jgi:hypothetical protein
VDLEQAVDAFGRDLDERATSVVDQHRELGLALDQRSEGIDATVLGQVGDEDAGRDAVLLTQTLFQRLESIGASGHQDDVVPGRGEALCLGCADARGRSSHRGHRASDRWLMSSP